MSALPPDEPTPAQRWSAALLGAPRIHGLNQLLSRYPTGSAPRVAADDLDMLDPWVIDGRYAADLPDLAPDEAEDLLLAARRVVEAVRASEPSVTPDL